MNDPGRQTRGGWWGVSVLALAGAAFALACRIEPSLAALPAADHPPSVGQALVTETRSALSAYFAGRADTYFHRGVEHVHREAFHS